MRLEPLRAGKETSLCARPSSPVATACSRALLRRRLTMAPAWLNRSDRMDLSASIASAAGAAGSATERQSRGRFGEGHALKRPAHSKRQHDTGQCALPIQIPVQANAANPPRRFASSARSHRSFSKVWFGLRPVESERSAACRSIGQPELLGSRREGYKCNTRVGLRKLSRSIAIPFSTRRTLRWKRSNECVPGASSNPLSRL